MRIGAPIFIAAFALLCAGMASTSRSLWENPYSDIQISLEMSSVHTVDITQTPSAQVLLTGRDSPKVSYSEHATSETNLEKPQISVRDGVMTIRFDPDGYVQPILTLPPSIRLIKTNDANLEAIDPIAALRIESKNGVSWTGDAGTLEIVSTATDNEYTGSVQIYQGKISQLSINSKASSVTLGQSSDIQNIRIRVGEKTSLQVSNAMDLKRINIEPIETTDAVQINE
jgi:hypothetical protein